MKTNDSTKWNKIFKPAKPADWSIYVKLLDSAICENDTHGKNTVCANEKDRSRFEIFTCLFC